MKRLFAAGLALGLIAGPAEARDLLVTIAKPDNLYVFDAAKRSLEKDCPLGVDATPGVIAMSPDHKVAYALVNHWEDIIGIDLGTCERVFYAKQSENGIRRKSIASLAVSKDGSEIYSIRNPTRLGVDRYEVMEPEFAIYATDAGLEAKPKAIHPAPRRSTVMAADKKGAVYIAGHDVYRMNPESGAIEVAIANANWDRPTYSPPDVLAFWPAWEQNEEMLLLYTAAVFTDEKQEELADFVWGYQAVNLEDGATEIDDFASLEVLMFSAIRDPKNDKHLYGVYTQLSKHDLETRELIKRVDLPHTYYAITASSDGKELYVGGTNDDIGIYDAESLERVGEMKVPSGGDMGVSTLQMIQGQ